jgi:hypothetical protein
VLDRKPVKPLRAHGRCRYSCFNFGTGCVAQCCAAHLWCVLDRKPLKPVLAHMRAGKDEKDAHAGRWPPLLVNRLPSKRRLPACGSPHPRLDPPRLDPPHGPYRHQGILDYPARLASRRWGQSASAPCHPPAPAPWYVGCSLSLWHGKALSLLLQRPTQAPQASIPVAPDCRGCPGYKWAVEGDATGVPRVDASALQCRGLH